LVPNHQSHADYVAINYMFYRKYKVPVYSAGGKNLNLPLLGFLFRKVGCFFIRRSFSSDITYKLSLEAYLYYLLKTGRVIEFFFEGGRSRTGKLLPPRFGLYGMLMDAHAELSKETSKKLTFIPVSIAHEYIPETRTLAKELAGGKKKKESFKQLFGLFKLFSYQLGSIHIKLGNPIEINSLRPNAAPGVMKREIEYLAFQCFREVGRNMLVTPTSLLSLIMLDEPSGAMLWKDILNKSSAIVNYCNKFKIPCTNSLNEQYRENSLERAMDILVGNKQVNIIGQKSGGSLYYSILEECRREILYSKNTIIHHFLIPSIINYAWINVFSGQTKSVDDLKKLFLQQRSQLKHEFYLPTVKQFFYGTLHVVGDAIDRKILKLEELMNFSNRELYMIVSGLGIFNRTFSYVSEAYYISGLTLKVLNEEYPEGFKRDVYKKRFKIIFYEQLKIGRIIRYQESYTVPLTESSLKYFIHQKLLVNEGGFLKIIEPGKLDGLIGRYEKNLLDQLTFNIRVPKAPKK
ncbi:MAG: 1-acyl-sn-glycerol-3-phosphate acyltransferase, partial [Halobacteriovoraceae bacterium]|nr:1-acyl-sn-glycerol-3-phosphate acyltransferase [Halobacteriovoraceae bacterium]